MRIVVNGLTLGPIFGQKPRVKQGKRGPAATPEQHEAFKASKRAFKQCVKTWLTSQQGPTHKDRALQYRRGGANKVLATPFARAALNAAFATGLEVTVTTLSQLSIMDVKVG